MPIGKKAHTPYHISPDGVEIYTIEELCLYVVMQAELLEEQFVDPALFDFIRTRLGLRTLSAELSEQWEAGRSLAGFCELLLTKCDFLRPDELKDVIRRIRENEEADEKEKLRKKLDRLRANKEYMALIRQCSLMLGRFNDGSDEQAPLRGMLLSRQAGAYALLFYYEPAAKLYQEAEEAYRKAGLTEEADKALQQQLLCLLMLWGEEKFLHYVEAHQRLVAPSLLARERYARAVRDMESREGAGHLLTEQEMLELRRDYERM